MKSVRNRTKIALEVLVTLIGRFLQAWSRRRTIKKVLARKRAQAISSFDYTDSPRISLIVLSFNHHGNVRSITERLRLTTADELIVCEDGSIDGSHRRWMKYLVRPNDFLIHSNDIHEIRANDRAIRYARGEFICLLQDDDIPPLDGGWVARAKKLFDLYPRLAVLSGHHGYAMDLDIKRREPAARWTYGFNSIPMWSFVKDIPFADPHTGIRFMFCEGVTVGPLFWRRAAYMELGGFDLSYGEPGEPGVLAEHAICLKAWTHGWQVALFEPPRFTKYVGGQGTMMFSQAARRRNEIDNLKRIRTAYGADVGQIERLVDELNGALVQI